MLSTGKYGNHKLLDVNLLSTYKGVTKGILFMDPLKFKGLNSDLGVTTHVYIGSTVRDMSQLVQMGGRSNRKRGACYCTYYLCTDESDTQVKERLEEAGVVELNSLLEVIN
jgi:hypothetical protein